MSCFLEQKRNIWGKSIGKSLNAPHSCWGPPIWLLEGALNDLKPSVNTAFPSVLQHAAPLAYPQASQLSFVWFIQKWTVGPEKFLIITYIIRFALWMALHLNDVPYALHSSKLIKIKQHMPEMFSSVLFSEEFQSSVRLIPHFLDIEILHTSSVCS